MTLIAGLRTGMAARGGSDSARLAVHPWRHGVAALTLAAMLGLAYGARADEDTPPSGVLDHPVLLELYTAQGCASCPPADAMMLDLAARDDVVALALHVDYWDYIGWADTFADRAYTERQQRYARRHGHSTIYTPQVVIDGTDIMEGFRVTQVMDTITDHRTRPVQVELSLTRTDTGHLVINAVPAAEATPQLAMASRRSAVASLSVNTVVGTLSMERPAPAAPADVADGAEVTEAASADEAAAEAAPVAVIPVAEYGPYSVQLVRYRPMDSVEILDGENAGRAAEYANIVTSWQVIANWDLLSPLQITVPLTGDEPAVVLVQESGQGEVMGVARLR